MYAQDGKIEAANALLDPLLKRERFHVSEFAALSKARCEVFLAENNVDGAKSWLSFLEQALPDYPVTGYLQARIVPASLMGAFENLMSRRRRPRRKK